jgi:hypothetical protein
MKAKFGALVVDGRGKIGGHVMSKNRGGAYMRTKVTPVNPRSASQIGVRATFAVYSSGWRSLTQAQRDAWNSMAIQYGRNDIFGDKKIPSGLALYQRLNNELISSGATAITTPLAPKAVSTVTIGTLTGTVGTPLLSLALSGAVPAATRVKVFATAPQSAGKAFVKSEFRLIGNFAAAQISPLVLTTMYINKFGAIGAIGTKIFVQIVFVDTTTGISSPAQPASIIIAA